MPIDDDLTAIKNLRKELLAQNDIIAVHLNTICNQSAYIKDLENLLAEYHNAFWWKITKPMRILTSSLKKAAGKAYRLIKPSVDSSSAWYISKQEAQAQRTHHFSKNIKFSITVPLYNTPEKFLRDLLDSVIDQTYGNWELCLADGSEAGFEYVERISNDCSKKYPGKIRYKKLADNLGIAENTNEAIKLATGDYIALLDHDDALHPSAFFYCMKEICDNDADFIYTDEAKFIRYKKDCFDLFYKPGFSVDMLRGCNYIGHLTVFSRTLLEKTGTFDTACDGSQDYDLFLRLTEQANNIAHIPKVLYFWRSHSDSVAGAPESKLYAYDAAIKAINKQLERTGLAGLAESTRQKGFYRIKYELAGTPLISIVIPDIDCIEELEKCIGSILVRTTYPNYEILLAVSSSSDPEISEYCKTLGSNGKIRFLVYTGEYNCPAINNYAASEAAGEYIVFLNSDTEIISCNWLEEMLMYAQREDVGAAGAMLYYSDNTIQHAGLILVSDDITDYAHNGFNRSHYGYFGRLLIAQNISAVTSACMMMPKAVFSQLGGFNDEFAVAFNDADLCMRIRQSGYLIVWTPHAELYHHESKSRKQEYTPEKQQRFHKEAELFRCKWADALNAGDPYYNVNIPYKIHTDSASGSHQ